MIKINVDQIKAILDAEEDIPIINVLSCEIYEHAHIPGSENIPLEDPNFLDRVADLTGTFEMPLVVYSANINCNASERAARKLEDIGYTRVYVFEGGLLEWQDAGLPISSYSNLNY